MRQRFELVGKVIGLEQKRFRTEEPIPDLWQVKLLTDEGERSVSFKSSVPKSGDDPQGESVPHPDFSTIQKAMETGATLRINGYVSTQEINGQPRELKSGTSAELIDVSESQAAARRDHPARGSSEIDIDKDDAKWASDNVIRIDRRSDSA
jgi:hypothetical protein